MCDTSRAISSSAPGMQVHRRPNRSSCPEAAIGPTWSKAGHHRFTREPRHYAHRHLHSHKCLSRRNISVVRSCDAGRISFEASGKLESATAVDEVQRCEHYPQRRLNAFCCDLPRFAPLHRVLERGDAAGMSINATQKCAGDLRTLAWLSTMPCTRLRHAAAHLDGLNRNTRQILEGLTMQYRKPGSGTTLTSSDHDISCRSHSGIFYTISYFKPHIHGTIYKL